MTLNCKIKSKQKGETNTRKAEIKYQRNRYLNRTAD